MTRQFILGLVLLACGLSAMAQETNDSDKDRQYVTDQLRLSLYAEPNSQSNVLKLLRSGDLLIVDEIRGPYALVTGPDGTRGWVKRGFLVTNPTANILLQEEREKNASLFEEIEKLSNSKTVIDTYEKDMDDMSERIEVLEAEKENALAEVDQLKQEAEAMQAVLAQRLVNNEPAVTVLWDVLRSYWKIILPLLLVLLAICFLITKAIIEARIKSRFHGIKIW